MDRDAVREICAKLDALHARVDVLSAKIDDLATAETIIARAERRREGQPARARRRQLKVVPAHPEPGRHLHVVRGD